MEVKTFIQSIINGPLGFKVQEERESVVYPDREVGLAEFVIRCLANLRCEGSLSVLESILLHRFTVDRQLSPQEKELLKEWLAALLRFSDVLLEKLLANERKRHFGDSWKLPDWQHQLQRDLLVHVQKGDPRDVDILALFAWYHNWSTAADIEKAPACKGYDDLSAEQLLELAALAQDQPAMAMVSMDDGIAFNRTVHGQHDVKVHFHCGDGSITRTRRDRQETVYNLFQIVDRCRQWGVDYTNRRDEA